MHRPVQPSVIAGFSGLLGASRVVDKGVTGVYRGLLETHRTEKPLPALTREGQSGLVQPDHQHCISCVSGPEFRLESLNPTQRRVSDGLRQPKTLTQVEALPQMWPKCGYGALAAAAKALGNG
jgi:hypothetical protein